MSYPFPPYKKQLFSWTFLKDVSVVCHFEAEEKDIAASSVSAFFKDHFDLSDIDIEKLRNTVLLQSKGEWLSFSFSLSKFQLKLRFPNYQGFDSVRHWFNLMEDYFTKLGISYFTKISVLKYNELPYTLSSDSVNVAEAMKEIFSANLLDGIFEEDSKDFKNLNRWERKLFLSDPETNTGMMFIYGFSEKDENKGVLTLKTVASTSDVRIPSSRFKETIDELNTLLNRAFLWSATEEIISQMKGGKDVQTI